MLVTVLMETMARTVSFLIRVLSKTSVIATENVSYSGLTCIGAIVRLDTSARTASGSICAFHHLASMEDSVRM